MQHPLRACACACASRVRRALALRMSYARSGVLRARGSPYLYSPVLDFVSLFDLREKRVQIHPDFRIVLESIDICSLLIVFAGGRQPPSPSAGASAVGCRPAWRSGGRPTRTLAREARLTRRLDAGRLHRRGLRRSRLAPVRERRQAHSLFSTQESKLPRDEPGISIGVLDKRLSRHEHPLGRTRSRVRHPRCHSGLQNDSFPRTTI